MNSKIFRQYDGPWAKKPYPTKGCTVSGAGCGLVACTHIAIEQDRYKDWTPENLRPWMVNKGFAIVNQGTRWEGITETLKHIGHTNVVRVYDDPMSVAFKELNKGNRIGIILFSKGYAGSSKVLWTTCGHYVAFTDYKYENNKHWFYTKDSGGRKHDGWYSYEGSMKGRVSKVWIVERINPIKTVVAPAVTADGKLVVDGVGGSATVKAMQRFFGTVQDGKLSGQSKALAKYYPSLKSVEYGKGGSPCAKNLQRWLSITQDGIWGKATSTALQKKLGVSADGIFGTESMKAWQKYLNEHDKAVYPTPTPKPQPTPTTKTQGDKIADSAKSYVGKVKYIKGGTSLKTGCDCTGFVQAIHKLHGIKLDVRKSWGKSVGKDVSKAKRGDVIYYYKNGKLHHMGIYDGNGKIVHCSTSHKDWHKDCCIDNVKLPGFKIGDIRRCWK